MAFFTTLKPAKVAVSVVLILSVGTVGTLVPSASAKADYTPPDNGHPDRTRGSGTRQTRVKDPRDSQNKNHPEACDRFEVKNFQELDKPLNPKENRWFKDFKCPVG